MQYAGAISYKITESSNAIGLPAQKEEVLTCAGSWALNACHFA